MRIRFFQKQEGIIALISVMVITSVIVIFGLSMALMSVDESLSGQVRLEGTKAGYLTSACVANALSRLKNNNATTGNVNINVANVNCIATISGSGNTRAINASATTTGVFTDDMVGRSNTNVNVATNPFTITQYKDILE